MNTTAKRVTKLMGYPSQNKLAEALGMDRAVISRWKNHIPEMHKARLLRLAERNNQPIRLRHIEACEA